MDSPMALALRTRLALGLTGLAGEDQVEHAAGLFRLVVVHEPDLTRRIGSPGVIYKRVVAVDAGIATGYRAFVVGHEIGHYVLGHGNLLYASGVTTVRVRRYEREADLFAGTLLLGLPRDPHDDVISQAHEAGVPADCLLRFCNAARDAWQRLAAGLWAGSLRAR